MSANECEGVKVQPTKKNFLNAIVMVMLGGVLSSCTGYVVTSPPAVSSHHRVWTCRTANRFGRYYYAKSYNRRVARAKSRRSCDRYSRSVCRFKMTSCYYYNR